MRARLALQATNTQCELREIVLRDKPESMLLLSPKGTVPVLKCADNQVIDESLDIMLWALRAADSHPWLSPEGAELGDALQLVERTEVEFKCHLDNYKYVQPGQEEQSLAHRGLASDFLKELDERLGRGQRLFGDR
ncbi:MAG: glutathione S-transferase N-terminal domain-containing protein, partial [Kofleriaceae bacterium]|nr:glutathione S-transferase N-terminal domain-containing protein [Kofleriaceae bacterium]